MVRPNEIAPGVPLDPGRHAGGDSTGAELRGSGFLAGEALTAQLLARARAEGFELVRVTRPDAVAEAAPRLAAWLAAGHHGTMEWMARPQRTAPALVWPAVRSIVVFGFNYGPDGAVHAPAPARGDISVYASGDDYHDVLKGALKRLGQWFAAKTGAEIKVFVDTAPVLEKPLAAAAGLGWQGKHTNLVSREFGSWLFLGALFTTAELPADAPEADHCGSCRACLAACPTSAFPAPYQLDARRCISYLTIEHKGPIAPEFRAAIGNRIYGCDACLAACPWNKFAVKGRELRLAARAANIAPPLADLAGLDDKAFRARFAKSPIKRIGRARFVRNVLIAIGNSQNPGLIEAAEARLDDESALVRGAAVWALGRLAPARVALLAPERLAREADSDVRAEWLAVAEAAPPRENK